MAPNERGRAAGATPDDDNDDIRQDTPADPLPPGFVDLGDGDVLGHGTAADFRAAAAWLHRHYPERSQDPPCGHTGPIYAMSNYRVRQVLGLGRMPERQRTFLVALATWMNDDTRVVTVAYSELMKNTGQAPNTVKAARRELEAGGKLASDPGGKYKGNRTVWTVLCLPATAGMGVSDVDPLTDGPMGVSDVDPLTTAGMGVKRQPVRGSNGAEIGGQPQRADQQEPDRGFNPQAKTSGSISLSAPASVADGGAGDGERENDPDDFDEDEEEPDPDFKFLAGAVPGADWRDVEDAVTGLQYRKHKGEIRTTVRAYLRKIIENGDAQALIDDAAAARRRGEMDVTRYGDPFGGSVRPDTGQGHVVAGEVVQSADVRPTDAPETRTPAPVLEMPGSPGWLEVQCPTCLAGPSCYCRSPAGGHSAPHAERHRAAAASQVEAAAS